MRFADFDKVAKLVERRQHLVSLLAKCKADLHPGARRARLQLTYFESEGPSVEITATGYGEAFVKSLGAGLRETAMRAISQEIETVQGQLIFFGVSEVPSVRAINSD